MLSKPGDPSTADDANHTDGASRLVTQPYLALIVECDRPLAGGARFALRDVDEVHIGRGDARAATRHSKNGRRTLVVSVPSATLSSQHARLVRDGGGWTLEDLQSRNGSFVDGVRVTRAPLEDGATFEAGRTFFVLRRSLLAPEGSVTDLDLESSSIDPGFATIDAALGHRLAALKQIAKSTISVVMLGESGTGKEVLARALHEASGRRGPFVAVNCGALPPALIEAQLFGHVKGAFSGAVRDEAGFVRAAEGGTLFLDEIGDLPIGAQPALLRVVQESEVVPVGATRPIRVDVRVLAATHRGLPELAQRGVFRPDLLARLSGFLHSLSPLRDRREDTGIFIARILREEPPALAERTRLTPEVGRILLAYSFPLNIRELRQALVASAVLAKDGLITSTLLPQEMVASAAAGRPSGVPPRALPTADEDTLRVTLESLLRQHAGNVSAVGRALGKAPVQIHRWLKRYGIDPDRFRA